MKELHSYEKEVEREAAKTADMKEKGADPCDLKQQMPPFSRVRDASRVRMRKIANGGQPSSAPPVDEEVNSYVGKPFEGNPIYDEVGALHASILSDSTPLHHSPSGSIPPASAAPQGNIPVPPQNPPPPLPAYQAYRPPPPDYYPPLCYAPPPAGAPLNVPSGVYIYPYYYPPAWGYGPTQVALGVNEESIAKRAKENGAVEFDGKKDPIVAVNFLDRVEKAFESMRLTDEQKCHHVYQFLTEQADRWWRNVRGKFTVANPLTWEKFKDEFKANYMNSSFMDEMRREFYCLTQGSRTVDQYDTLFHELVQFVPYLRDNEQGKMDHFLNGLNAELRSRMRLLTMNSLTEMASYARRAKFEQKEWQIGQDYQRNKRNRDEMREFYCLTQGSRTVDQYDTLFHELVQFVPYLRDNEQGKMDHFFNGLNAELRSRMRLLTINSLTEMASYARKVEFAEKEWHIGQDYQRKRRNRERGPTGEGSPNKKMNDSRPSSSYQMSFGQPNKQARSMSSQGSTRTPPSMTPSA